MAACAAPTVREGYVPCRIIVHMRECIGVPMASTEADAAAKRFAPPDTGMVHVYLVRPYTQESTKKSDVFLNGKPVAVLGPTTYVMFDAPPGRNTLWVKTENDVEMLLETEPGRIYFVQYQRDRLFNTVTPRLKLLRQEDGKGKVLRGRRVFSG